MGQASYKVALWGFQFVKITFTLFTGCDGRAGTVATVDGCGKCGGDNSSCKGCDGQLNSGATLSEYG